MDRLTIEQLDRTERKVDNITAGIAELLHGDSVLSAINLLQNEIYETEGELTHLKEDVKVKTFFDKLALQVGYNDDNEEEDDDEDETSGKSTSALNMSSNIDRVESDRDWES